jgi:DNA repair photolyase
MLSGENGGVSVSSQIISASRRTDIPAFYSEWFINRIQAGSFVKVNPYNSKQRSQVSLLPMDVAAIVFWTKNPLPLLRHLPLLDNLNYRYMFHFTLNNYNKILEPRVPELQERILTFKKLSDKIGPEKVMWRYDPIIIGSFDSVDDHLEHFRQIAGQLQGYTHRVTISLVMLYDKVLANFKKLAPKYSIQITDMRAATQHEQLAVLAKGLSSIAGEYGLEILSCSEKINLKDFNIKPASCIDVGLINRVFNLDLKETKDKYQRPECGCAPSVDLGFYDTCQFGCVYCYANTSMKAVEHNVAQHDPSSSTLLG